MPRPNRKPYPGVGRGVATSDQVSACEVAPPPIEKASVAPSRNLVSPPRRPAHFPSFPRYGSRVCLSASWQRVAGPSLSWIDDLAPATTTDERDSGQEDHQ